MKKNIFYFVFLNSVFFAFFSCSSSKQEKEEEKEELPTYVLPADKMVNVLVDLHIIDAAINLNYINQSALIYNKKKLQDSVFVKYKINSSIFDSSVVWYGKHLPELKNIYDTITVKLNKMHAETQR